jgi:hypothetical protein
MGLRRRGVAALFLAGALAAPAALAAGEIEGDAYDALGACEKQARLWERIEASRHEKLPPFMPLGLKEVTSMMMQSVRVKLDRRSDVAPEGWVKHLHARGSVAKIKFVPVDSIYTGLFKGVDCGLIRLSLTSDPGHDDKHGKGVAPGLALKFLVDGKPSANVSALTSLIPQGQNYNFFTSALSNVVPRWKAVGASVVHFIFRSATKNPERLSVEGFGAVTKDGKAVEKPFAPVQLFFVPGDERLVFAKESHDVREDFHSIPAETVLYKVHAVKRVVDYSDYKEEDKAELLAASVHIGNIVTTSPFVSSEFGDSRLFFNHQRSDD